MRKYILAAVVLVVIAAAYCSSAHALNCMTTCNGNVCYTQCN